MKQRLSNIELLRILAMLFIVIVHLDGAALGLPRPTGDASLLTARDWWRLAVESFSIVGVNCFTLISGYFGIRFNWRGLLNFTLECLFYSVLIYFVMIAAGHARWSWPTMIDVCRVYTHTDLWYVPAYLGLYLLSPFLNAAVTLMSRSRFTMLTLVFVLYNVWAGWLYEGRFNPTGYTVIQLVMIYLVGRMLSLYNLRAVPRSLSLALYIAMAVVTVFMAVWLPSNMAFAYNSPVIIVQSVALFVFFTGFEFISPTVNRLAAGSFAVYLIHKNPYVWVSYIVPSAVAMWRSLTLWQYTAWMLVVAVTIFILSSLFDMARSKFLTVK